MQKVRRFFKSSIWQKQNIQEILLVNGDRMNKIGNYKVENLGMHSQGNKMKQENNLSIFANARFLNSKLSLQTIQRTISTWVLSSGIHTIKLYFWYKKVDRFNDNNKDKARSWLDNQSEIVHGQVVNQAKANHLS